MPRSHLLKIKYAYYEALRQGVKTHELRFNDRDFQTGDLIHFCWDDMPRGHITQYDGMWEITHVLHYPDGLKDGWVILSLKKL